MCTNVNIQNYASIVYQLNLVEHIGLFISIVSACHCFLSVMCVCVCFFHLVQTCVDLQLDSGRTLDACVGLVCIYVCLISRIKLFGLCVCVAS